MRKSIYGSRGNHPSAFPFFSHSNLSAIPAARQYFLWDKLPRPTESMLHPSPLPIAAEIDARLVVHRQPDKPVNLEAVRLFAVILAPCGLLGEADQVGAGDMMVVADFATAHPAEEGLGVVRVDLARQAVGFLMIDPVQCVPGM